MGKLTQVLVTLAVACAVNFSVKAGEVACSGTSTPQVHSGYSVRVDSSQTSHKLAPEFFGFNVEWVEFQLSLWDSNAQRVNPDAIEWLKVFPGATYRYPGGTVANYFNWREAIGDVKRREPQRAVSWREPIVAEFGLDEYLRFVEAVGGKPWYVLNLFGTMAEEKAPATQAREAGELATYMLRRPAGKPAIFRWELGNELDRDRYLWRPEKYADVAAQAAAAIRAVDRNARFVALSQDWNASKERFGIDSVAYNVIVGRALAQDTREFASHHYYDGRPWGPPVPQQLKQHCRNLEALERGVGSRIGIWITEHGRTPKGTPADSNWKRNWPQSADLSAAISVADMVVAMGGQPSIKGMMAHALHATDGPWPLFHRSKEGRLSPSAVYWGLRVLRESLLEDVLYSATGSANRSGSEAGYDMRALAMASVDRSKFSLWLTNRAGSPASVALQVTALANFSGSATVTTVSSLDSSVNNYGGVANIRPRHENRQLTFDGMGNTTLDVPANAVVSVVISRAGRP